MSSFDWSPDSARLVLLSRDPEETEDDETDGSDSANGDAADAGGKLHDTQKPIVMDRYLFKQDGLGWLGDRNQRLYVFDLESREASLLTPGAYDSVQPAWGPGSDIIAFSSRRQGDPDRHRTAISM